MKRYSRGTTVAIGLLLVTIGLEMTLPRISGKAITQLRGEMAFRQGTAAAPTGWSSPWSYAELFVGVAFLRGCLAFAMGRLRNVLVQGTLKDIRAAYFDAVQRLSFAYHDKTNTGELISRGTADISRLQEFLFACLFLGVDITVAVTFTVILITIISPAAGLATFLTLVPTVGVIVYCARRLHPQWRKVHDLHGELTIAIQENIAGVRVVKAFAREPDEIAKFCGRRDAFVKTLLETVNYWAGRVPGAQLLFGLSMPLALWIVGNEVIAGTQPVGNLAAIVFYLMGIGARMNPIGQFVNIIQNASASAERVMEVLEEPLKMQGGSRPLAAQGSARVDFENVSFHYPTGSGAALQEISFVAKPGQTVAVLGETGAGKSTLVHLVPRFYDPTGGIIRIDGVDIREIDLRQLRRSVGMIFQETVLFSATVADNIAYGRSARGPCARVHHRDGTRLRHHRRGARRFPQRRPEAAPGHRPRLSARSADPDFGRRHLQPRLKDRAADPGRHAARLLRPHRLRHRAPADHCAARRSRHRPARRPHRGAGHSGRFDAGRRLVPGLVPRAVGRPDCRKDFQRRQDMSEPVDVLLEEALAKKSLDLAMLRRLAAWSRPYRASVFLSLGGTLSLIVSQLFGPKLIQTGIDRFLTHITTPSVAVHGILIISTIYLGNLLLGWGLTVMQIKAAIRVGQGMLNDIRLEVFEHIQRLSLSYFDKTHQGRIINRADSDIDAMDQVLTWGANQMLGSAMTLVGVLIMMVRLDWKLCLAVSLVLPPLATATYLFQKYIMQAHRQVRQQSSRLTASLAENISGVRVVQSMGREKENLQRFEGIHRVYTDRAYDVAKIFHTFMPTLGLVSGIGIAIVLGYGGHLVLRGQMTVGDLAAFILYVQMFFGPVQVMGDLYNNVLSAGASAERIFQLLDTRPQVVDRPAAKSLPPIRGEVRFEGVSFRYESTSDDRWILEDVDFLAGAGQTVALVGHTGSGKTSIISLLARFYEPQFGRILIDGTDVAQTTIESLHRQLGIVTQENFLFSGTIIGNLRFGRPEATEEEVIAAAKALGTDEIIRDMKEGYLTKVGERGGNLSAGERQLLCITRALVAGPRILILDEATSAVDPKSEALIQAALDVLLQGRTTFVVAHRLSTIRKASLILVLAQGRIVERGTHESLIAAGGVYAGLHEEFSRHS
jgi:ATP-binding cassette subfamily B protein